MPTDVLESRRAGAGPVDVPDYPFESQWRDLSEGRIHYVDEGRGGEALLFVHGTPTWSYEWRHVIRALSPRFRCVAPDHLGFGLSDRPAAASYTPESHAARLSAFVDELGLRDFTLVVHDFGGPIGLPLALEPRYRVKRLVVLNSWMWSFADDARMALGARWMGGGLGRFLYGWANASLRLLLPSAWGDGRKLTRTIHRAYLDRFPDRESRERVLWALARSLLASDAHYRWLWERRGQLEPKPALIVWGMKDTAFRPAQLARWRDALPRAEVVELADAGHWPQEEAPESVAAAIEAFVR